MSERFLASQAYLNLKAAARRLAKSAGGVESAASITRWDFSQISRSGSPNGNVYMPVDVVADLEADVGEPIITKALADLCGYVLIQKPDVKDASQWVEKIGALGKEAGEALAALSAAFSVGGTITADEIRDLKLRDEVRQAMEVLSAIDMRLKDIQDTEQ